MLNASLHLQPTSTPDSGVIPELLEGATIVVAHPDDEVMWFSSVLSRARKIVIAFSDIPSRPDYSAGRRAALAAFPLPGLEALLLTESEAYFAAAWPDPTPDPFGLAVRRDDDTMPGFSLSRYRKNFGRLVEALRPRLRDAKVVCTHGPWGEYGHEEHVQVFRAVDALRVELGFRMFFTNYVSNRSQQLFARYLPRLPEATFTLPTDAPLCAALMDLYKRTNCWTWYDDYRWPAHESFIEWLGDDRPVVKGGQSYPMNFIRLQAAGKPVRARFSVGQLRHRFADLRDTMRV